MDFPAAELLEWFGKNQRPLPWRKEYFPYEVWVSEAMLQQTRVEQMLPYFERFLKQFPTVEKLAEAKEEIVLKAWEGLGYYSRARNLHQAAKKITTEFHGKIPSTAAELKQLPGFGEYLSNAVASIAFNKPAAVVDGNVFRVLSRFFGISSDISEPATKKEFQERAQQLLPKEKGREFNQALMELGALVCVPQQPLCSQCPLQEKCFARKNNRQSAFPVKAKKQKRALRVFAAVLAQNREKVWLVQRKQKLLQGLWEFPSVPFHPLADSKKEIEKKFFQEFGETVLLGKEIGRINHEYTHFCQQIVLFEATAPKKQRAHWTPKKSVQSLPLSRANQKLLEIAYENEF